METHDETTPIDRPIMLSDIHALKGAIHGLETSVLAIHQQLRPLLNEQSRRRWSVSVCVICAMLCLGAVLVRFA